MNKSRGSGHQRPEPRDARHGKMMGNLLGECLAFWVTRFFALLEWYVFFWEHVSQDVPWRLEQNMEYGGWEEGRFFGATSQSKVDLCRMTRGKLYRTPNWGPKKTYISVRFPSTSWSWGLTSRVWHRSGSAHSTRAAGHSNSEESLCTMGTAGPVSSSWWLEIPLVGGCL